MKIYQVSTLLLSLFYIVVISKILSVLTWATYYIINTINSQRKKC